MYHPTDERFTRDSGLVYVIAPTEGGPYPTVVVFHGNPGLVSKKWHRIDAAMIASRVGSSSYPPGVIRPQRTGV